MMMPYIEFREFADPQNAVCQLLQAHFIAMQLIMAPIMTVEWQGKQSLVPSNRSGRWLDSLHRNIPTHMLEYCEWTLWFEGVVSSGHHLNGIL